jgi:hypothetical protein
MTTQDKPQDPRQELRQELMAALKADFDRLGNYGAPHGKKLPKVKRTPEHCIDMLEIRYPNLAKALR